MANPPAVADPNAETVLAKQAPVPRFFRDMNDDAFFADEASDEPSLRDGLSAGKLRVNIFQDDSFLADFNPLENVAYTGAICTAPKIPKAQRRLNHYEELGYDRAATTTPGDEKDYDLTLVKNHAEPSPNVDMYRARLADDPGNASVNAPRFPRRRFATWVDIALHEEFGGQEWDNYQIHVPASFHAHHAKITLLFGVGGDLNRHGVRHFLRNSTDTILINVPGTEGYRAEHTRLVRGERFTGKHWGVGITKAQIEYLLRRAEIEVPWEISVLAAFSTGYRGLYATLMNTRFPDDETWVEQDSPLPQHVTPIVGPRVRRKLPTGTLLGSALSDVKRLVIYDCLYRDDTAKIGKPNTLRDVLDRLARLAWKRSAKKPIDLLLYDATTAGSSQQLRPFDRQIDTLKLENSIRDTYQLDLRCLRQNLDVVTSPESVEWLAVIVCRLLREALTDEQIDPGFFHAKLDTKPYAGAKSTIMALIDRLGQPEWKRGTITSMDKGHGKHRSYREFLSPDERAIFKNAMELLRRDFITPFKLLAWRPGNLGEIAHDGLLVEFGWEGLIA
jgi:hypothetical protein